MQVKFDQIYKDDLVSAIGLGLGLGREFGETDRDRCIWPSCGVLAYNFIL